VSANRSCHDNVDGEGDVEEEDDDCLDDETLTDLSVGAVLPSSRRLRNASRRGRGRMMGVIKPWVPSWRFRKEGFISFLLSLPSSSSSSSSGKRAIDEKYVDCNGIFCVSNNDDAVGGVFINCRPWSVLVFAMVEYDDDERPVVNKDLARAIGVWILIFGIEDDMIWLE